MEAMVSTVIKKSWKMETCVMICAIHTEVDQPQARFETCHSGCISILLAFTITLRPRLKEVAKVLFLDLGARMVCIHKQSIDTTSFPHLYILSSRQ